MSKSKGSTSKRKTPKKYVLVAPSARWKAGFPKKSRTVIGTDPNSLVSVTSMVDRNTIWFSETRDRTDYLTKTLSRFYGSRYGDVRLGNLVTLQPSAVRSKELLPGWFNRVIPVKKTLPNKQLFEVFGLPDEKRRDLFIGGAVYLDLQQIKLIRGDLTSILAPFSIFRPSGTSKPNFRQFSLGDYGNTLRFGNYEATADVVLWEMDADYRKRARAKEKQAATGLGPALRRLRIQRGLSQSDFGTITRKTISRIENGEIEKPHSKTLNAIAKRLGVSPEDIDTY